MKSNHVLIHSQTFHGSAANLTRIRGLGRENRLLQCMPPFVSIFLPGFSPELWVCGSSSSRNNHAIANRRS